MQDVFGIIDNDKDGFVSKTDLKKRYQDCYNDIDLSLEEDRVDALFERLGKDDEEQVSYEGMLKWSDKSISVTFACKLRGCT